MIPNKGIQASLIERTEAFIRTLHEIRSLPCTTDKKEAR